MAKRWWIGVWFVGVSCAVAATPPCPFGDVAPSSAPAEYARWTADVVGAGKPPADGSIPWPASLRTRFTGADRFATAEAGVKLRDPILSAIQDLMVEFSTGGGVQHLDHVLATTRDRVRAYYRETQYTRDAIQKGVDRLEALWKKFRGDLPLTSFQVDTFVKMATRFEQTMAHYREKYPDLVDSEVTVGSGFGYLASHIIMTTLGSKPASEKALAAIALLHPLTDNALDRGMDIRGSMKKITHLLKGEPQVAETSYEKAVFELIGDIFETYPRDRFPELADALLSLHLAQLESSQVQRNPQATTEQLLDIAARKGGYTAVVLALLSKGKLGPKEHEFYFKSGSLFQLGDDLLDVKEDVRDGVRTLWSTAQGDPAAMREALGRFMAIQTYLETQGAHLAKEDPSLAPLVNDLKMGVKFYLLSGYLNGDAGKHFQQLVQDRFPISPENAKAMAFAVLLKIRELGSQVSPELSRAIETYARVLDRHFLGDQLAAFEAKGPHTPEGTWQIAHNHPLFPLVRIANELQWFTKRGQIPGQNTFLGQAAPTAFLFYAILPHATSSPYVLVPMAAAVAPLLAYKKTRPWMFLGAPVAATSFMWAQMDPGSFKSLVPTIGLAAALMPKDPANRMAMLLGLSIAISSKYAWDRWQDGGGWIREDEEELKRRAEVERQARRVGEQ